MPQGRRLIELLSQPVPAGPAQPLPQDYGPRPAPMTLGDYIKAIILGGVAGIPSPYKNDLPYERGSALGELMTLGLGPVIGMAKGAKLAEAATPEVKAGIKAYHGSPHDFDKFSLGKIGTGEGAQAYGHGLYFAENPDVAQSYKTAGSAGATRLDAINARLAEVSKEMDKLSPHGYRQFSDKAKGQQLADEYDQLMASRHQLGKTYEVNINADPELFLDWDKPLSQQSQKVQAVLTGKLPEVRSVKLGNGHFGVSRISPDGSGKVIVGIQADTPEQAMSQYNGSRIYEDLADVADVRARGSMTYAERKRSAAGNLKKSGIAGIKYLDGSSRAAGTGSSNYVVFDDAIIDIARKFGIALPVAAAYKAYLDQQQGRPAARPTQ